MATSTAPIGQSLFDFLDGKTGLEQLEALQSGTLVREINRYVQTQLEQFHIGSIQDSIQNSIWGNGSRNSTVTEVSPVTVTTGAVVSSTLTVLVAVPTLSEASVDV